MASIEEAVDEYVDRLAAEMYQQRARSRQEMTDERWARIKTMFPGSARICRADVERLHAEDIEAFRATLILQSKDASC